MASRVELFNLAAAAIFAELYENFPVPITIKAASLAAQLFTDEDTGEDIDEKWAVFEATLSWLKQAGFIWTGRMSGFEAEDVVLSPKGLEVLKMPSALEKKHEPLGQVLIDTVKKGAKEAASGAVSFALTAGFKLLAGHVLPGADSGAP